MYFFSLGQHVHNSARGQRVIFLLIALLAVWHGLFFLFGYRLTADDTFFASVSLSESSDVFETAKSFAEGTGRIGFLYLMPINIYSAEKSEFLAWRLLFVTLYMLTVWLAFIYASRVMKEGIAPLAFLIFLSLHPLAFEHLPPTSFPLQNTLPFLILITSRLTVQIIGERDAWIVVGRLLQIIAMLSTEYALLLGVVMISAETFSRHPFCLRSFSTWLQGMLRDARLWRDVATLILVIGPYVSYRLVFPSTYDGNTLNGIGNLDALIKTTFWHIADGLVLPRLQFHFLQAPFMVWAGTLVFGIIMYVSVNIVLHMNTPKIKSPGAVVIFILGAMIFVTFPVTASVKQQSWCAGEEHCAFLDSRTTILGVAILLSVAFVQLMNWVRGTRAQRFIQHAASAIIAIFFVVTSLHNWNVAQKMIVSSNIWEGARALACVPSLTPGRPDQLSKLIDPNSIIMFHNAEGRESFWPIYIENARSRHDCAYTDTINRSAIGSYLPNLRVGLPQPVGGDQGVNYLGKGWSSLEPWGVWSDGNQAQLVLKPVGAMSGELLYLELHAQVFLDQDVQSQRLTITQDGQKIWDGTLGKSNHLFQIKAPLLPYDPTQDFLTINLSLPDAHAPITSADRRMLGIGLKSITLLRPYN